MHHEVRIERVTTTEGTEIHGMGEIISTNQQEIRWPSGSPLYATF